MLLPFLITFSGDFASEHWITSPERELLTIFFNDNRDFSIPVFADVAGGVFSVCS